MEEKIRIKGAREHNLKNISTEIPREKITVITGLSGSGKSTLAFDTLYAEGQRRYVESLSSYARQFLGLMNKPDVDSIEGLSPAISIDQKTTSRNPRSTVGTVTEIYDYLRLLYARVGQPHCPVCKNPISSQSTDQIAENLQKNFGKEKTEILAVIARGEKGTFAKELEKLKKKGIYNCTIDSEEADISEEIPTLEKNKKHTILARLDRITIREENKKRLHEAIEAALAEGKGFMVAKKGDDERTYSQKNACSEHGISLGALQPRDFSFNSPFGACPECHGLGFKMEFDTDLIIPDKSISLWDGAIKCFSRLMEGGWRAHQILEVAKEYGIDPRKPVSQIPKEKLDILLYGTDKKMKFSYKSKKKNTHYEYESSHEGIIPMLERLYHQTESERRKEEIAKFMREKTCPGCEGMRLKKEILAVTVGGKNIIEFTNLPIAAACAFTQKLSLGSSESKIAFPILKEINSRLEFLENVGLYYLTLSRESATLSGGESQRIRLATQIGSNLTGIVYVLDEPSIGLHQRDNSKLLSTLRKLRELGNTLVIVEHDEDTMWESDHIIDMGPGAGRLGGEIVAEGAVSEIIANKKSLTGDYLAGRREIPAPKERRQAKRKLSLLGASEHNLRGVDVDFPLGLFICISGVSGSGKSSLITETLYPALSNRLLRSKLEEGKHAGLEGEERLEKVISVDQSPIGRTPRSNPATYIGAFTPIRELFAKTPEARARGYSPGRFSFNVHKGRCENCQGNGLIKIEMHFLADVYVPCEECKGKRYNSQTLEIEYKAKTISDVLEMSVNEALEFFKNIPAIKNRLQTMQDVGLGYIKLGQPATTLSGGEAQRVKLATELSRRSGGKTLYILDEPTTGLHFEDVSKLLSVLQRLVDMGNTVIVIEHNLDVLKSADWIIDLGPEGGSEGGQIVAEGAPEEVANSGTYTGAYLKSALSKKEEIAKC
ncbi:excinuclease ABC subunit UvrA [Candidatus Micrarchaeota archaeon]|nr:excinuclease ABC subunit UvrA [Candidatus Micrarchaeota archaeon]